MDGLFLPILIALSIGLFAWGVYLVWHDAGNNGEKRKLKERLVSDEQLPADVAPTQSVVLLQVQYTGLPKSIGDRPAAQALHRLVTQAFPSLNLLTFLGIAVAAAIVAGGLLWAIMDSIPLALVVAGFAGYIPFFIILSRRNGRQRTLENQLPEALDFLSRILRAGHSLTTGLQMMGEELPKPINDEFRRCYDQHSLGQALEDSLREMTARIQSTDFAFFVTAVLIQRQTGGDLSEVLTNISGMIRQRIRLQQHVKAKTAEGRFTGYILVAFPAMMFGLLYILNPANVLEMLHSSSGVKMLGVSFVLQMLGLYAIRKITTIRV